MDFLEGMLQKDKDEFTRICNRLLSNCFICRRNETARGDYYLSPDIRRSLRSIWR